MAIPGDGVGPELVAAAQRVIAAAGVAIEWDIQRAGRAAVDAGDVPLPERVLEAIRTAGAALKGPLETGTAGEFRSPNLDLRQKLGLYAQVRPVRTWPGVPGVWRGVDLAVVRETTEGLYAGVEFPPGDRVTRELVEWLGAHDRRLPLDSGLTISVTSPGSVRRLVEFAFDYAAARRRRRVTAVHKASAMPSTDGLFLAVAAEVAGGHPAIEFEEILVDRLAMELVRDPRRFDVLVAPSLHGDVVSDLAAGLVGGTGLAPGGSYGGGIAVFEAAHGIVRSRIGTGAANPLAMILSGAMLLGHLGMDGPAASIERAVATVLADGGAVTSDLVPGSTATTAEVVEAVVMALSTAG